jgi:hypothetical protein
VFLEKSAGGGAPIAGDAVELMVVWRELESVCKLGGEALELANEGGLLDDFSVTILRVRPSSLPFLLMA